MKTFSEKLIILYILLLDTENHYVNDCRLDESYCIYWCLIFYYKVLPFAHWCFFGIPANWLVDTPAIYLDGTIKLSLEVLRQPIKWKAPEMEATRAVPLCSGLPEGVKQPVCLCVP